MTAINNSPKNNECPLKTPPFEKVFEDFYFRKQNLYYSIKSPSEKDRNLGAQINRNETIPEWISYKNKKWEFIKNVNFDWQFGELHCRKSAVEGNWKNYPAHLHTDLSILDEHFHIDFYAIGYWGPGRSLQEIRVYENDALITRGGRGNVFMASFSRNLPLVVPIKKNILIFHEIIYYHEKGDGVLEIPASLWTRSVDSTPDNH